LFLESEAGLLVGGEDLLDRVDVGGRAQIQSQVVLEGGLHDGPGGALHGVVEARVDNVLLGGARNALLERVARRDRNAAADAAETPLQRLLHRLKQVVVGLALVLEGEAAVRHVVQVLEPLEERDGDTSGVDVQVGNHKNVAVDQDFVGGGRRRAVGRLADDLGVDLARVLLGDHLLDGGRHKDVARLVDQVLALVRLRAGEAYDGAVLVAPLLQLLKKTTAHPCLSTGKMQIMQLFVHLPKKIVHLKTRIINNGIKSAEFNVLSIRYFKKQLFSGNTYIFEQQAFEWKMSVFGGKNLLQWNCHHASHLKFHIF